ncbi:MAG TPA: hypothetical protein VH482_19500 [Thermomicrobiales bacterium]|jgi:hypothetical protein
MTAALKTITVDPDSEVARVLAQAAEAPILIETRGARFRIVREDEDPFANYDPERARAAAERAFGTLKGVDVEKLLAELKEQRAQDSQGRPA